MKAAIYIRVSTKQQNTDRQFAELEAYANLKGYNIVETYEDKISGFKDEDERFSLIRLKEDALDNKFDIILFSELSRLSRKTATILELIEYFRKCGKELYFQKQNIYLSKDKKELGSELQLNILSTISSYEIELSSERQQGGKIQKAKNHCWVHGARPYGYNLDEKKKLYINKDEAKIIKEIYQLYLDGYTSVQIAHLLNNRKIKAPANKNKKSNLWHPNSVCQIIRAERNIGTFKAIYHEPDPTNKETVRKRNNRKIAETIIYTDKNLAIINEDIYYSTNEKMDKSINNRNTAKKNIGLLKQLLKCGHCGSNFFYKVSTKSQYSYICFGSRYSFSIGRKKCEKPTSIIGEKIDGLIIDICKLKLLCKKTFENTEENIENFKEEIEKKKEDIKQCEESIKELDEKFNKYLKKAIKYNLNDSIIEEEHQDNQKQKTQMYNLIKSLKNDIKDINKKIKANEKAKSIKQEYYENMGLIETKQLFEEYIENIYIYNSKQWFIINIQYYDGDNEFAFLRKAGMANKKLHFNIIAKELLSPKNYELRKKENLLYHEEDKIYYYPYYNNLKGEVIYDKEKDIFFKGNKKYTVNDFIEYIKPKKFSQARFYQYENLKHKKGNI